MSFILKKENFDRRHFIDLAIRFALALTFAAAAGGYFSSAINHLKGTDLAHANIEVLSNVLCICAVGFYTLLIACLYVVRLRPISTASGAWPCAAAILGGFLMSGLLFLSPRTDLPLPVKIFACTLVLVGNLFTIVILLRLGRSFSIVPEARKLVTTGPYGVVRHPLYLAEAIATLGVVINYLSPWALVLIVLQLILQLVRIHYEEGVLRETFPEYEQYAKRTWRVIPGLY